MSNEMADQPPSTAADIAWNVRNNIASAADVLERHLAAIDDRESDIHAFNLVLADEARARAAEIDEAVAVGRDPGPLAGVPVALKDNMCTRGIPTTCSSKILDGWKPPYDATVVTKLHEAGAIVIGKTNLDEFAMGSSTENSAFGATRNPHDTSRVPGGSSGGSAAAVAAGFAAVSLGSDTGGSIRQPAALCGVVGVKPTYGAVSRYGLVAFASSLDQIGPFAHDVADAALVLESISGHDQMDSTSIRRGPLEITRQLDMGVAGLRVGRITDLPAGASPDVAARLDEAFDALRDAGAEIVDVEVPAFGYGLTAYYLIAPAEASSNLARYDGVRFGHRVEAPDTNADVHGDAHRRLRRRGQAPHHARHLRAVSGLLRRLLRPSAEGPPPHRRRLRRCLRTRRRVAHAGVADRRVPPSVTRRPTRWRCTCATPTRSRRTSPAIPAMSVPFGTGDDGLPVGVQVLAPALEESRMFRTAAELERRAPR